MKIFFLLLKFSLYCIRCIVICIYSHTNFSCWTSIIIHYYWSMRLFSDYQSNVWEKEAPRPCPQRSVLMTTLCVCVSVYAVHLMCVNVCGWSARVAAGERMWSWKGMLGWLALLTCKWTGRAGVWWDWGNKGTIGQWRFLSTPHSSDPAARAPRLELWWTFLAASWDCRSSTNTKT